MSEMCIRDRLYIDQTGDTDVLFERTTYFKDYQSMRGTSHDEEWNTTYGNKPVSYTHLTFAEGALDAAQQTGKLSYDGYKKVWSDEFNGDSLRCV